MNQVLRAAAVFALLWMMALTLAMLIGAVTGWYEVPQ